MASALSTFSRCPYSNDHLAAAVQSGSIANGTLRILGDESRSVVRRRGGGNGGVGGKAFWVLHLTKLGVSFHPVGYCGGTNPEDNHFFMCKLGLSK